MDQVTGKGQWGIVIAGSLTTLLVLTICIAQFPLARHLDLIIYDRFLQAYHTSPATHLPVIIDIDERSLREVGQWPWPRYQVAFLLKTLQKYEVAAVATDIIFAEPDMSSPNLIQQKVKEALGVDITIQGLPQALKDNDLLLADNLKTGPFVLGFDFVSDTNSQTQGSPNCSLTSIHPTIIKSQNALPVQEALPQADNAICPLPILSRSAPKAGFITIAADEDAVYRRVPLLFSWREEIYPSLAVAALQQAFPKQNLVVRVNKRGVESIRFGNSIIPTDSRGRMLIHYKGPSRTFDYISAVDILKHSIDRSDLKGRIAFIGTSAAGLKDIRPTPLDPSFPGVETHATIVDNILSGQFIHEPEWTITIEIIAIIVTGATMTLLLILANALWLSVPVVILCLNIWYGSIGIFTQLGLFISPLYPLLVLILTFTLLTAIKYWREEQAKKFIHSAFSHYLAPSVISQIIKNPDSLKLEGQEKDVSIQFSDIRKFTALSEHLTPHQVTALLHDYLTPMTSIITKHNGTLDKFIGDAVMAFWNAPVDVENYQLESVKAALAQQKELSSLNKVFQEKYGISIEVGIGLHAGSVHVGNMGSAELFDYTLVGDDVNLASRIEGLTKYYGLEILVSQTIAEACDDTFYFRFIDMVRVKGKEEPVSIYSVHEQEEVSRRAKEFQIFNDAMRAYSEARFSETLKMIKELKKYQTDKRLYNLYEKRCINLIAEPPDATWDGVFQHIEK